MFKMPTLFTLFTTMFTKNEHCSCSIPCFNYIGKISQALLIFIVLLLSIIYMRVGYSNNEHS